MILLLILFHLHSSSSFLIPSIISPSFYFSSSFLHTPLSLLTLSPLTSFLLFLSFFYIFLFLSLSVLDRCLSPSGLSPSSFSLYSFILPLPSLCFSFVPRYHPLLLSLLLFFLYNSSLSSPFLSSSS